MASRSSRVQSARILTPALRTRPLSCLSGSLSLGLSVVLWGCQLPDDADESAVASHTSCPPAKGPLPAHASVHLAESLLL